MDIHIFKYIFFSNVSQEQSFFANVFLQFYSWLIKHIKLGILVLLSASFILWVSSCGNQNKDDPAQNTVKSDSHAHADDHDHNESDGHNHDTPDDHNHEDVNVATLTAAQIKAIDLQVSKIERKSLTMEVKANGVVRVPNNHIGIASSLFGGVIRTLKVLPGTIVKKGQLIATIAHPQFISAQEDYLTTKSKLQLAEQEMQRQVEMAEGNAGAKKNVQIATSELNTLKARKASLEQQLSMMGIQPNRVSNNNFIREIVITSPVNGVVSQVFGKLGSFVDVATPIAEIVDNSMLHIDILVYEKDLGKIKVGQTVDFRITNNPIKLYTAKVFSIGSTFESNSKAIAVHCEVTGYKSGLIDGMNITAGINTTNEMLPAVPNTSVVESDGKYYVFVEKNNSHNANDNRSFERYEVIKGVSELGFTGITFIKEVSDDVRVVTKGGFFVNAMLTNSGEHSHDH